MSHGVRTTFALVGLLGAAAIVAANQSGAPPEVFTISLQAKVDGNNHFVDIVANQAELDAIKIIPGDTITVDALPKAAFRVETWFQTYSWTEDRKSGKTTIHETIHQPASKPWELAWGSSLHQVLHLGDVAIELGTVSSDKHHRPRASSTSIKNSLASMVVVKPNRSVPRPSRAPAKATATPLQVRCNFVEGQELAKVNITIRRAAPKP